MKSQKPKRVSYDEAMNEVFQVIFENLKEIEKENKRNWDKNNILRNEEAVLFLQFSAKKRQFIEHITKREICLPLYSNQVKFAESRELNNIVCINNAHSTELAIITTPHELASPASTS